MMIIIKMENDEYKNIYRINTNCVYDTEHLKYSMLTDKTFVFDENIVKLIEKDRSNIIENYSDDQLLKMYQQIVPIEKIKRDILIYDFMYGVPNVVCENVNDVINLLLNQLKQYQWTVGGFNIEDNEWLECNENSRFKPTSLQKAFYNSLESHNDDQELRWFLKTILGRVLHSMKYDIGVKIYYKIIEDKSNEISWVIFVIENIAQIKIDA